MLLPFEITTETVCSKHLKQAEQHEKTQSVDEMAHARNLGILLQGVVILIDQATA